MGDCDLLCADIKKMFKREPFNITVDEGQFVSLPCEPPEGNPVPEVSFHHHYCCCCNCYTATSTTITTTTTTTT